LGGVRRLNSGYPVRRKDFPRRGFKYVESVSRGFEGLHRGYGLREINVEGKSILDFSSAFELTIANACLRKREQHLITYKSGVSCSQIDFFLIRKSDRKICLDCKVIL